MNLFFMKMKNIKYLFILWLLLSSCSVVHSQSLFKNPRSQKKWEIQIGIDDLNYPPINSPFKNFFIKNNNNILLPFYNLKLVNKITKQIDLYLDSSFGITENNKWNTNDGHYYKIIPGINYHIYKYARLDPYLKLGLGYHFFNYDNHQLIISKEKTFLENATHFLLLDGGIGMNLWILPDIGINVQSEYNHVFSHTKPVLKDYLNFWRHSMGIVYNFNIESNQDKHKNDTCLKNIYNNINVKNVDKKNDTTKNDKDKKDDTTKNDKDKKDDTTKNIDKDKKDDTTKNDKDKKDKNLDISISHKKTNKKKITNKKSTNKKSTNKKINKKKTNKKKTNKKKTNKKKTNKKKTNKKKTNKKKTNKKKIYNKNKK
ncbi:hypothetical protein [Blattabacterium cuenoti]|uniref:hypothetical protein n=1 Tax=Blattabacterium cuenoti TaxID=1653831 RepID=UPI00163C4B4B|nr:hypothetical protein [Blattabacterium cuenoti]